MSGNRLAQAVVGILVLMVASACGSSKPKAAAPSQSTNLQQTLSKDDQARCEFKGRTDRDVSEATATGALRPNIRRVYQLIGEGGDMHKVLICREVDTNLDGVKDVVRTFNEKGEPLHEEADSDYDGKVDTWITFANGRVGKEVLDTNGDGKPDVWKFYTNGKLSRIQRDTNGDGNPDVWEIYANGHLERRGVDTNFDGHVDRWDRDELAQRTTETRESADNKSATDAGVAPSAAKTDESDAGVAVPDTGAEAAPAKSKNGSTPSPAPKPAPHAGPSATP